MNPDHLLKQFETISEADYAVPRLRRFILDLAMRGKLVEQKSNDAAALQLMSRIEHEKVRLAKSGKTKLETTLPPIDDIPYAIPQAWAWVRLGSTGRIFNGNSISEGIKRTLARVKDGYPFVATKDVGYGRDKLNYENGLRVPHSEVGYKVAHKNAVLICAEGGSAGKKIGLTDRDICFGNKLYANEVWNGINPRYIFYVYQTPSFFEEFTSRMTGIIGGIARSEFLMLPVPIPPENEQHRIVAKVDELMELCDAMEVARTQRETHRDQLVAATLRRLSNGNANPEISNGTNFKQTARFYFNYLPRLTTRLEHIKQLRQTILNLAIRGELVTHEPGDEPATELLKRIVAKQRPRKIEGTAKNRGTLPAASEDEGLFSLPTGWLWAQLRDLLDNSRDISYGVIKLGAEPKKGGVYTLRCSDVRPGFIDLSGVRRVSEEIECNYVRTRLRGGEILLNVRGTLGGVAVVPMELKGYNVAREVAVVPVSDEVAATYLLNVMLSPYFWDSTLKELRGIAYKGLNLGSLRLFWIPLPPVAEQHRIVAKVDELMTLCNELEVQLTTTATTRRQLLEATLHEALSGSLEHNQPMRCAS